MPIEVETLDGIVEFPDDTDSATIESALRRRFSPPPSPVMSDDEFSDFESSFLQPKPALGFEPTDIRQVPGISQEVAGVFGGDREQPQGEAREILGDPLAFAFTPFSVFGRPLNAAVQDLGATIAGAPELGGNLYELATRDAPVFSSEPIPYQETLADISKDYPAIATAGKVAAGLVESAPMLSIMPQGAMGKLVAAGFTADMIGNAGEAATRLGVEMGKAPKDRDADAITSALSEIILAAGPAPFAGAHAGGRFVGERIAPKAEAIRELAKTLKNEPFVQGDRPVQINRELGISKASLTGEPFLQPGVRELADAALREAQSPIARPDPAIERLRREIEPPQIIPIEPTRVAERIEGGGEAPYGKTSFMREAEAPTAERTQLAREIERQLAVEEPTPAAEPINPGGSQQSLPEALRIKSEQNNSLKAFSEANGVPFVEGDTAASILAKVTEKSKAEPTAKPDQIQSESAPVVTASQVNDAIYIQFDKRGGKVPTAAELTQQFKDAGYNVEFQEFAQDIGSVAGDRVKFKGSAMDRSGAASSREAASAYAKVLGTSEPISAKTQAEGKIPAKERFKEAASIKPKPAPAEAKVEALTSPEVAPKTEAAGKPAASNLKGSVYQSGEKWLVQSGDVRGFGDTIWETEAQAKAYSEQSLRIEKANAEFQAKQKALAEKMESEKAAQDAPLNEYLNSVGASPMQRGKMKSSLEQSTAKRNESKTYSGKRFNVVSDMVDDGYTPKSERVQAIANKSRTAFNRMDRRQQEEFAKRQAEAGDKTEYRLESTDGRFFTVTKAEHDYAKWYLDKKSQTPNLKSPSIPPAELKVGEESVKYGRYQLPGSPQTYTVVERLTQSASEKANNEQPVRIKNERTGKEEVVLESELKEVRESPPKAFPKTKQDLDKALRDAGLDPSLFPDEKSKRAGIKREIAKLESESAGASVARAKTISEKLAALKFKADKNGKVIPDDPGQVFSLPHPDAVKQIGKQLWNDSIDAAIKAVEAGKTVAQAVEAAIRKIAYNAGRGYNEAKIRANLESILKEEAAPKPTEIQKAVEPQRKADAGLDDVYRIFEPDKKPGTPIKERAINVAEAVRTGFSSKFRPINKLAEDISKSYGRGSSRDIAGIMEQLKGSQGKGEAQVYRFDRDVSKLVRGREKDFNAYMFLRRSLDRLQQDAADITKAQSGGDVKQLNRRSVGRYAIPELEAKLSTLESKLGPEILPKFEKAAEGYQRYMDEALRLQVESGRMSLEVYRAIKEGNEFYAPFKVMKYLEEQSRPEGSGGKIDTTTGFTKAMIGIEDPNFKLGDMLGAARQSILLSRILADKNSAMRHVAELAAFDVDGRFIQRLRANAEPPRGWEAVNVIENGRTVKYATRPEVADALQLYGGTGGGIVSRTLSAFSVPFRAGATALNLPFQVSNLIADVPRQALVSKYGVRNAADLVRYPLDFAHALFSSISGDVFGRDSKLFLDFLDSGVAGTTIQEYLTPQALKFREPTTISKSRKLASSVINVIPEFAKAIEQTSKVMGVKRAMRIEGVKSGAELAKQIPEAITELRRFSGSPDFGRQGKVVEQARLNLLYMFLNARIQGAVADVGRLAGRDGAKTAATTWFKIGTAVGIPTAYLYALNQSEEFKEDYAKRSKQEKDNYWLIPKDSYITTEDGEKLRDYWRIPKRESSKWMANLTEAALDFAQERDPKAMAEFAGKMVQELSPVNVSGETARERLESVASSLNPVLKAPLELASGRDFYRHRDIIPDSMQEASPEQQFTQRTAEAFKKLAGAMPDVAPEFLRSPLLLENITRNLTAGLLTQFLKRKPVEGRSNIENAALLQRFQALPYADNEAFRQEMRQLERVAADEYLARHRAAEKLTKDNPKKPLHEIAMQANGDVRLVRHLADLWIAQQNGATSQDKQLLSLPARQRATYIANQLKEMNTEQKQQAIQDFARKRILTEAVLQEMPENFEQ